MGYKRSSSGSNNIWSNSRTPQEQHRRPKAQFSASEKQQVNARVVRIERIRTFTWGRRELAELVVGDQNSSVGDAG